MTIYEQPNSYECGPFALKHALLTLGIFQSERRLALLAGTDRGGTDESELARVAAVFACDLPTVRMGNCERARLALIHQLRCGNPVLACIDQWEHWVSIANEVDGRFIIFDSATPGVVQTMDWQALAERWVYRDDAGSGRGHGVEVFDLHPLVPRKPVPARARLTLDAATLLVREDCCELRRDWSAHAGELIGLSDTVGTTDEERSPVAMVDLVRQLRYGSRDPRTRALRDLGLVAEAYGLSVPSERRQAVVRELEGVVERMCK